MTASISVQKVTVIYMYSQIKANWIAYSLTSKLFMVKLMALKMRSTYHLGIYVYVRVTPVPHITVRETHYCKVVVPTQ